MVDHAETLAGEGQSRFPGWYHFRRRGDLHQKCQGCRTKEGGKICSRTDTCAVCHSWSPREWDALDAAIALSVCRRTNRSRSKEGTVTHQEDVLTLEPEEDTDFDDNKKTKSGKGEMSESLPSRFPEDRGESPLLWDVPRDSTSGEKPSVVVGDSMFYAEDMNGNRVETARSSMERPVQSHTIGVDSGHPAKGSDAGHPVRESDARHLAMGSDARHPCTGSDAGQSDKRSDAGHPGQIQRRLIPFRRTERGWRVVRSLKLDRGWHMQCLDDQRGHQVPSWSGPVS